MELPVLPQYPDSARWIAERLQPHEPMLRAWLRSRFPKDCDVDDIIQEAYMRILQARETTEIASPKAFFFATARNLALGNLRRKKLCNEDSLTEIDVQSIMDASVDVPHEVARSQELEILTQAIQSLPARCRQILTLRKIYGMSQRNVAAQLGIAEHTVEAQGAIGMRKIVEFFARLERLGAGPP